MIAFRRRQLALVKTHSLVIVGFLEQKPSVRFRALLSQSFFWVVVAGMSAFTGRTRHASRLDCGASRPHAMLVLKGELGVAHGDSMGHAQRKVLILSPPLEDFKSPPIQNNPDILLISDRVRRNSRDLDLGKAQSVAESNQNLNPSVSVRFRHLEVAVNVVLDLTIRLAANRVLYAAMSRQWELCSGLGTTVDQQ